jgi:anti-anti-sigma factor
VTHATVDVKSDGETVHIVLAGEIDMANAPLVEDEVSEAITNHVTSATIDLGQVSYLDSAGLRFLFDLAARLPTLQIDLELIAPAGSASRRVAEMSGLVAVARVTPEAGSPSPG